MDGFGYSIKEEGNGRMKGEGYVRMIGGGGGQKCIERKRITEALLGFL